MSTALPNIMDLGFSELQQAVMSINEPAFRATQIHQWLFSHHSESFEEMTTLSRALRHKLAETFSIKRPQLVSRTGSTMESGDNLTEKILLELPDHQLIETVLIPAENRLTACLSSQAGCAFQCAFCATGKMGLHRNLTAGEITGQVYALEKMIAQRTPEQKITNIVFMGMGEPLMNYDNVIESIETLTEKEYSFTLSRKKITISTVGIIPEIQRLGRSGLKTKLAISLHTAEQEKRESLMPIAARRWPLKDLGKALADYTSATARPVTLVYMLLKGINDSPEDAKMLARFAHGFLCKINLIDYNSIINISFKPVNSSSRELFQRYLIDSGLHVTVRKSFGTTINAACGQLATSGMRNRNNL